jgi:hypothetical protein
MCFCSLTPKGREHRAEKTGEWRQLARAMEWMLDNSMRPSSEEA